MVEIIRNLQTFMGIKEQWNRVAASFQTPLLRHEWFVSCLESFYQENDLHIIVVQENDEITAAAPLVCVERMGVKWLEFIGVSRLGEPCGLLFSDSASLDKLVVALLKIGKLFVLSRISSELAVIESFCKLSKKRNGLLFHRQTAPSSLIECHSSWETIYASISSRRRYDHRLARKRAEKRGQVLFKTLRPTIQDYPSLLEEAFEVESSGWKKRKGSALLIDTRLHQFFLGVAQWAARNNHLRIFLMYVDSTPVAMQICLEYANKLWALKVGYNEQYSECSPGVQLMNFTIRYACEMNLESFEFLGSKEPWLQVWANKDHRYSTIVYYPINPQGLAGFGMDMLRVGGKRLNKHIAQFNK